MDLSSPAAYTNMGPMLADKALGALLLMGRLGGAMMPVFSIRIREGLLLTDLGMVWETAFWKWLLV